MFGKELIDEICPQGTPQYLRESVPTGQVCLLAAFLTLDI